MAMIVYPILLVHFYGRSYDLQYTFNNSGMFNECWKGGGQAYIVEIRGHTVGSEGSNGSELMCLFHNTPKLVQVALTFKNSSNIIVVSNRNTGAVITDRGKHLVGRVILDGFTDLSSNSTSLIFTKLQCTDEGLYWCQIGQFEDGNYLTYISEQYVLAIDIKDGSTVSTNAGYSDNNDTTATTVLSVVCVILVVVIIVGSVLHFLQRKRWQSKDSKDEVQTSAPYESVSNDRTAHNYADLQLKENEYNTID